MCSEGMFIHTVITGTGVPLDDTASPSVPLSLLLIDFGTILEQSLVHIPIFTPCTQLTFSNLIAIAFHLIPQSPNLKWNSNMQYLFASCKHSMHEEVNSGFLLCM